MLRRILRRFGVWCAAFCAAWRGRLGEVIVGHLQVVLLWRFYGSPHRGGAERKVHTAQKPLTVMRGVVAICPEGGLVLDPFAGSGTTLLAAKELGRRAVGIDWDEQWCRAAVQRLGEG